MNFQEGKFWGNFGEKAGFVLMYLVFTTVAYFLLSFLHKLPESWNYFYMLPLTISIVLLGILLTQFFKL